MHAQKQNQRHQETSLHRSPLMRYMIGNQAVQVLPHTNDEGHKVRPGTLATTRFAHDFSRIPVHTTIPTAVQHSGSVAPAGKAEDSRFTFDNRRFNWDKLNSDARLNNAFHNNSPLTNAYKGGLDSSRTSRFPSTRSSTHLVAGDRPDESEGLVLGGEADGNAATAAAPQAGAIGGDATSISTANLSAPEWKNNGEFKWWIKWATDGTKGWIVQQIENTYSGTRADGTAITNASMGAEPSYYEAWEVAASGTITGSLGATGNRDRWQRPALGALGSPTSFSMKGTVYWTSKDPAASGFTSGGVGNAGALLSSKSAPAGIGSALLVRSAHGMWAKDGTQMWPGCFTS
ncbi:MAG: hypothetical protein H7Z16_07705 [Pyrinomonadaceae bacterium]|nr:hypothetical protein [Pyrinomonadaceae bacterium]